MPFLENVHPLSTCCSASRFSATLAAWQSRSASTESEGEKTRHVREGIPPHATEDRKEAEDGNLVAGRKRRASATSRRPLPTSPHDSDTTPAPSPSSGILPPTSNAASSNIVAWGRATTSIQRRPDTLSTIYPSLSFPSLHTELFHRFLSLRKNISRAL